ncbi:MAG: cytochrome c oxidase assembly protein [Candidatus Nanopelagicaceae bacterium]
MVDLLLVLSKFVYLLSATLTAGFLIAIVFLANNLNGLIRSEHKNLRKKVAVAAWVWAFSSALFILATLASVLDVGIGSALDFTMLRSFVTQISLGKFLAVQTIGALSVALLITRINRITYAALVLIIALAALAAPVSQSHSASGGSHLVAMGTLIVHVIAISMWVGGLLAILFSRELDKNLALQRFSQLALWAALAVVGSGVINAWIRMNFSGAWQGAYAILITEKILLTLLLLVLAAFARKRLAGNINKLITVEAAVMVLTLLIGTLLSQSQPPTKPGIIDPIESLVGLRYPGTPTMQKFIFEYQPDALTLALLILAALLYFKGIRIMRKRGDKWPVGRSLSFFSGILVINYAINGAIGVYAHFGFSYHMIEHMILGMIAPIFIVLGAPITLALRTLPLGRDEEEEGPRNILIRFLHSKYAKLLTNPVVALLIFDGSLFILYFTGLFGTLMGSHLGHQFMNLHFLLAGILFFHVIVGVDPNPNRPPNVVRLVILLAAMSIHAFFSIALMSATTVLDGGYYTTIGNPMNLNLLENQYVGGSIGWAMGEFPILIALTAAFIQWMREDRRETERIDRKAARASAMGENDDLAKYNQYLAELARKDEKSF